MKLINNILAALVLLSSATIPARADDSVEAISRDSIMTIVHAAEANDPAALNTLAGWYYNGIHLERDYSVAARLWAKAASMGDAVAIGNLGMCYREGNGVEADSTKAMGLYTKSLRMGNQALFDAIREGADHGNAFDCNAMGYFFTEGIGCKKDYATGASYYATNARRGNLLAIRDAGLAYLNAKDYKNAYKWFKRGAEEENITCIYYYGRLTVEGLGCTADPSKGFVYALKAAERGFANAQYYVSELYRDGRGVNASAEASEKWLRSAAVQGLPKAVLDYGKLMASKEDFVTAAYMFSWLVDRHSFVPQMTALFSANDPASIRTTAFGRYALTLKALSVGDIKGAKDNLKAFKKLTKSPMADVLEAMILLNPANEKRDPAKAVKILSKVCEKDKYNYARCYLAGILERGVDGIDPDVPRALELLETAASEDYPLAFNALGNGYYEEIFKGERYETAVEYYQKAFDSGLMLSAPAHRFVRCLDDGEGWPTSHDYASIIESCQYPAEISDFLQIVPFTTE